MPTQKLHNIQLDIHGNATSSPHVKHGDKVEWTAAADSWVDPPDIFAACKGVIDIPAGQTLPRPPCEVTGKPETYEYSSGLKTKKKHIDVGNDTIIVDP